MCTKLHTVAASNNRDQPTRSLYYCLFTPHTHIFVLHAHPVRGESHNQRNTSGEVATRQNRHSLWHFQNLRGSVCFAIGGKGTAVVILPLEIVRLVGLVK